MPVSRSRGRGSLAGVAVVAAVSVLVGGLGGPTPAAAAAGGHDAGAVAGSRHPGGSPLPSTFQWRSSGALVSPKPDATHPIVSVKDPTVVFFKNRWNVYVTTANTAGNWSLAYLSFRDWSHASAAPQSFLDTNPGIGTGFRAAPQLFYFAPQHKWYLLYGTGVPSYSTTTDPTKPETWSATRNIVDAEPPIVTQNKGPNGFWLDYWVICDAVNCYLFSEDDNGHLYRSQTTVRDFPNGFSDPVIALQGARFDLFEASNVYKLAGTNTYLLLVEAIGATGRRYFRSWTSTRLDGAWTPLAATEAAPFAGAANVAFRRGTPAWTQDISHGEMLRAGIDQHLTIDPCHLRYLYQGEDPSASGEYSQLPWRLGLLTQTNARC
jgi:hypothetical protein